MNADDREWAGLIRQSLAPSEPPSPVDLWPRFERRLDERRASVGKLDWILAAVGLGLLASFPEALMLVLYHL